MSKALRDLMAVTVEKTYSVQWRKPQVEVAELASMLFLEKKDIKFAAKHFGVSVETVKWWVLYFRRRKFVHKRIKPSLRKKLLLVSES